MTINPNQIKKLTEMFNQGKTDYEIGQELGIHPQTIYINRRILGLFRRKQVTYSKEMKRKFVSEYSEGQMSIANLARKYGMNYSTATMMLRINGIKARPWKTRGLVKKEWKNAKVYEQGGVIISLGRRPFMDLGIGEEELKKGLQWKHESVMPDKIILTLRKKEQEVPEYVIQPIVSAVAASTKIPRGYVRRKKPEQCPDCGKWCQVLKLHRRIKHEGLKWNLPQRYTSPKPSISPV